MFQPFNRHLHVQTFEPDEAEPTAVLVPDSYKISKEIEVVQILGTSSDSNLELSVGDIAIVEGHMIKSLDLGEETVHVVLENYVLGTYNPQQEG